MNKFLLNLSCEDKIGIVAAVSNALHSLGGNIVSNSAFSEPVTNTYCMRVVFETDKSDESEILEKLCQAVRSFNAKLSLRPVSKLPKVAVLVSKYDHCLIDLLHRTSNGELPIEIPIVISNHDATRKVAEQFAAEFRHVEVINGETRMIEKELRSAIEEYNIDFVVLARYMQIISKDLAIELHGRIINIHHSFLPGFKGAAPFIQAWERGVKMIGATAHFVTEQLDEGPIISQDAKAVSHRDSAETLKLKSKDIERLVLAEAVEAKALGKVFLCGTKTVVFD